MRDDYVLTLQSFSKTYAMPGFRIGYAAGPEDVVKAMTKLHIFTSLAAPTISQMIATEALNGPQACVEKMRREYDRRRRMIIKRLNEIPGFCCTNPKGAFYAFPTFDHDISSEDFAMELVKAGVICAPGSAFGKGGEGHLRFSFANSLENIEKGMDILERVASGIPRKN